MHVSMYKGKGKGEDLCGNEKVRCLCKRLF